MSFIRYISSIASSVRKNKKQRSKRNLETVHPIHNIDKDKHLNWVEEGNCQCCGAESGEYKGICDECRLS